MALVDFSAQRIDRGVNMLTKAVDRCKDVSSIMTIIDVFSRITVIDNEMWLKYSLRRCIDACNDISSRITVVDNEILSKYSLRRCLINAFQECINQSVDGCKPVQDSNAQSIADSINIGL